MIAINRRDLAYGLDAIGETVSIFSLARPYSLLLALGCLLLLVTNILILAFPSLLNAAISLIEKKQGAKVSLLFTQIEFVSLTQLLMAIVALGLAGAIIRTLSRMAIFDVGRRIENDVRSKLFFHASILDDSFSKRAPVGDVMNHMTTDVANIRMITGFASLNIMNIVFVFVLTVPYLVRIDSAIALATLLPFPLMMISTWALTKKMFLATKGYQEELGHMVSHVQENLHGAHVVRLLNQQESESARFLLTNQKTFDASMAVSRIRILMLPMMRLVLGISISLVILLGGMAVLDGRIGIGDFVEVNTRILQLSWPAMSIGFVMSIFARGQASIKRINHILATKPKITDGDLEIDEIKNIDVAGLKLNTSSADEGVSFVVNQGEMLGIVGRSGSYKSTLLRYLYRRIPVLNGTVFFNGHDINSLKLKSIYDQIAVVSEESYFFNQSILENVRFCRPSASIEEVLEILRAVEFESDLKSFPNGIDTIIGERGVTLSGGQRQRIALARALIADRSVLILDDSLSATDAKTENKIIDYLKSSLSEKIVIFTAHRVSTLRHATRILMLEQGKIVDHIGYQE